MKKEYKMKEQIDFALVYSLIVSTKNRQFLSPGNYTDGDAPYMGAASCLCFLDGCLAVPQLGHELGVRAPFFCQKKEQYCPVSVQSQQKEVEDLSLVGYTNWRLPEHKELAYIVETMAHTHPQQMRPISRTQIPRSIGRLLPAQVIPATRGTYTSTMAMTETSTVSRTTPMAGACEGPSRNNCRTGGQ